MTKREWVMLGIALLVIGLALWTNYLGQRQVIRSLDSLSQQLDAKEQARIDLLEARVIALEKTQARLRAKVEEN